MRFARAAVAVLVTALLLPSAALAVTSEELENIGTTPASTDTAPHVSGGLGSAGRVLVGLVLVLAAIMAIYWILRRTQGARIPGAGRHGDVLDVLSTTSLGANRQLQLVRVGGEVLLLGVTDHAISALHMLDREQAIAHGLVEEADKAASLLAPGVDDALAPVSRTPGPAGRLARPAERSLIDALRDRTSR